MQDELELLKKYVKPATPTPNSTPTSTSTPIATPNALFKEAFSKLESDFQTQFKKPYRITGEDTKLHKRPSLNGRARDIGYRDRTPEERAWIKKRANELGLDIIESDGTEPWSSGPHGHVEAKDSEAMILSKYVKKATQPTETVQVTSPPAQVPTFKKRLSPISPSPSSSPSSSSSPPSTNEKLALAEWIKMGMPPSTTTTTPKPPLKVLSTTNRGTPKRTPTLYGTTQGATSGPHLGGGLDSILHGADIASRPFAYTSTLVAGLQRHIGAALSDILTGDSTYKNYSLPKVLEAAATRFYTGQVPKGYEQPVAELYNLLVQKYGGDPNTIMNQIIKGTLEIGTDPTTLGIGRAVAPKILKKTFSPIPQTGMKFTEGSFLSPEEELAGVGRGRTEEEVLKKYVKPKATKAATPTTVTTSPVLPTTQATQATQAAPTTQVAPPLKKATPKKATTKTEPTIEVPQELTKDISKATTPTTLAKKGDLELHSTVSHPAIRGGKPLKVKADYADTVMLELEDGTSVILPKSHPAYTEIVQGVDETVAKEKIVKQKEIAKKKELTKKKKEKVEAKAAETKVAAPKPKLATKPKKALTPKVESKPEPKPEPTIETPLKQGDKGYLGSKWEDIDQLKHSLRMADEGNARVTSGKYSYTDPQAELDGTSIASWEDEIGLKQQELLKAGKITERELEDITSNYKNTPKEPSPKPTSKRIVSSDGGHDVTMPDGTHYRIFRDPEDTNWYIDAPDKGPTGKRDGDWVRRLLSTSSKEEALTKLAKDHAEGKWNHAQLIDIDPTPSSSPTKTTKPPLTRNQKKGLTLQKGKQDKALRQGDVTKLSDEQLTTVLKDVDYYGKKRVDEVAAEIATRAAKSTAKPKPVAIVGIGKGGYEHQMDWILKNKDIPEEVKEQIRQGNFKHYDMKSLPEHGDILDNLDSHSSVIGMHLYGVKGEAPSLKPDYFYNKANSTLAEEASKKGVATYFMGDKPTPIKPTLVKKADIPSTTSTKPSVKSPFKSALDAEADDLSDADLQTVISNPSSFTKDQLYNANWEKNYRVMQGTWKGVVEEGPQSLDEAANAATKRLKDIIKDTSGEESRGIFGGRLSALSSTQSIKDMTVVGAKHLDSGIRNFTAWSERMIDEFGEDIRSQLKNIYHLSDEELFRTKGIEYRNAGLSFRSAIHDADNLNIVPNSPKLPSGSTAKFQVKYPDEKGYTNRFSSPLSRAGLKGQYELKDPIYGKQLSDAFRSAQHNTEELLLDYQKRQHKIAENLDKAFRSTSSSTLFPSKLKSLTLGSKSKEVRDKFMKDFIDLIEKPFSDPTRLSLVNGNSPLGRALKLHDSLTDDMRKYIIDTQRQLGRDLPTDWGITEKGYFRHLFLGNIEIFEHHPTQGKIFRTTATNYAEAQKWFFNELKTNPNISIEATARDVFNGDPTLRVTTKKLYKFLGQVSNTIDDVAGIKISTADLHEDLRGVVGREAAKQKQLGALFKREDYSGFSTDYHNIMTMHAEQLARSQELSKLNKSIQNIKEKLTAQGKSGLAEEAQLHLDHLWGKPSIGELRFGNWIRKQKVLRNHVDNPDTALRNLAQRIATINNLIRLDWNPRSTLVNHFQPLTTLYPYTSSKQYATYYLDMLKPSTWKRLQDLGVLGSSSKLEVGATKKTLFNLASDFNRGMGYLHGEADALRLGKKGIDAERWAKEWAERVEFDNSKWNVAPILRSPSAKIIGQYKGFLFKEVENIKHNLSRHPSDTTLSLATRRVKSLGTRLALGGLNVGLKALPIAVTATIIDGLTDKIEHYSGGTIDKSTSRKLATAVVYGSPSLIGMDLSGSFSLIDLFGNTPAEIGANLLMGPTLGTAANVATNYDDPKKLVERISPYPRSLSRIKDLAQGKSSTVSLDQTKDLLLTRYETIMEALGIPSVRRSLFYEYRKEGINPVTGVKKPPPPETPRPKRLIKKLDIEKEDK